jgi:GTPase SAR1 family protein
VVFDITSTKISIHYLDENSFNNLHKWIDNVKEERGTDAAIFLLGNKIDL